MPRGRLGPPPAVGNAARDSRIEGHKYWLSRAVSRVMMDTCGSFGNTFWLSGNNYWLLGERRLGT